MDASVDFLNSENISSSLVIPGSTIRLLKSEMVVDTNDRERSLIYDNYEEYCKDTFMIDGILQAGRTCLNYPKGVVVTYKEGDKLSYKYSGLNQTNQELLDWIENQTKENFHEIKWWKIERFECTLVKRDREWWMNSIDKILQFYKDLLHYRNDPNELQNLKDRILASKKRKKKVEDIG